MKGLFIAVVLLSGCVTLSEDQRFENEALLLVAVDQFQLKKRACDRANGVIVMERPATRIKRKFTRFEYNSARCTRLTGFLMR